MKGTELVGYKWLPMNEERKVDLPYWIIYYLYHTSRGPLGSCLSSLPASRVSLSSSSSSMSYSYSKNLGVE